MELIGNDQFLSWAHGLGIGYGNRYPGAESLTYLPDPYFSRFWTFPDDAAVWPYFTACFLEGIDLWQSLLLWPRGGSWPRAPGPRNWNESVRDVVLRGAGVPRGWSGAARFGREAAAAVVAVMFAAMLAGGSVPDDVYLVPDHGRQILLVNHHEVVHACFRDEARLLEFVAYMEGKDYALPTEVPDETFKPPP